MLSKFNLQFVQRVQVKLRVRINSQWACNVAICVLEDWKKGQRSNTQSTDGMVARKKKGLFQFHTNRLSWQRRESNQGTAWIKSSILAFRAFCACQHTKYHLQDAFCYPFLCLSAFMCLCLYMFPCLTVSLSMDLSVSVFFSYFLLLLCLCLHLFLYVSYVSLCLCLNVFSFSVLVSFYVLVSVFVCCSLCLY